MKLAAQDKAEHTLGLLSDAYVSADRQTPHTSLLLWQAVQRNLFPQARKRERA